MKRVQNFLLLLTLFNALSSNLKAQWTPTNSQSCRMIYALQADNNYLFAGSQNGILNSQDDGITWNLMGLLNEEVREIHLLDNKVFVLTGSSGVKMSPDMGNTWLPVTGLYYTWVSTLAVSDTIMYAGTYQNVLRSYDRGSTWESLNNGAILGTVTCIATKGDNIYAGTNGTGLFRSSNNGLTWTKMTAGLSDYQMNMLLVDADKIYLATSGGLFVSSNNGSSWTLLNGGLGNTSVNAVCISDAYMFVGTTDGAVLRSSNNGTTWEQVNNGIFGSAINSVLVHNGKTMAAGTGFFISSDYGNAWEYRNAGMTTFFASCFIDFNNRIICGSNGKTVYSDDRGRSWNIVDLPSNDLLSTCIDKNDSLVFLGTSRGFFVSSDSGLSWSPRNGGLYHPYVTSLIKTSEGLLAGTSEGGVYFSADNGMHWSARNSGIETACVSTFLPVENGLIAGMCEGGLYRSNNNGVTWSALSTTGLPQWIWSLVNHNGQLFAGTPIGLYTSTDGGNTWALTGNGLGEVAVRLLKSVGNALFLADEADFFVSLDNGSNWSSVADGLPPDEVNTIFQSDDNLIAGTNYNGIWMRPVNNLLPVAEIPNIAEVSVWPNPATNYLNIKMHSHHHVNATLSDGTGRELGRFQFTNNHCLDISHLPAGFYLLTLSSGQNVRVTRFVKK